MRIVIQRVKEASVTIHGTCIGKIGKGLLLLVGFEAADTNEDLAWIAKKTVQLRIFDDANGVMNLSLEELQAPPSNQEVGLFVVSQFTLHASTKKGNRPSYFRAAPPPIAIPLYEAFVRELRTAFSGTIQTGQFGAEMEVNLTNDGPVTICIDSKSRE